MDFTWWIVDIFLALLVVYIIYAIYIEITRKYCFRKINRRLRKSQPEMIVILDNQFRVVKVHNYDSNVSPYLKEELLNSNLWDVLSSDFATKVYKGYQNAINKGSLATINYKSEECNAVFELRFFPLQETYVTCFVKKRMKQN